MGARESCGLIVFGRREGNYSAYGLSDSEGKFLGKLYSNMRTLKCKTSACSINYRLLSNFWGTTWFAH